MPEYAAVNGPIQVPRNVMLLDTSVLVASFCGTEPEERSEYAQYLLHEEDEWELLIPVAALVESWGLIVGSRRRFNDGTALLDWIGSPGAVTIVPQHRVVSGTTHTVIHKHRIDCVDAMIAELATDIGNQCSFGHAVPIATFDTGDFTRMLEAPGFFYSLLDMNTYEMVG